MGYVSDIAVCGPLVLPGITGCYYCQQNIANESHEDDALQKIIKRINNRYQAPSHPAVNMLAAAMGSLNVMKFLGRFGKVNCFNKRVGIWSDQLRIEEQTCTLNPQCKYCASAQKNNQHTRQDLLRLSSSTTEDYN